MFNQNFNNQYANFQNFLNMLQMYSNIIPNLPNNFGQYYGNNNNNFGNIQTQFMFNPFNDQNVIVNGGVMPRNDNFLLKSNADLFSNYPPGPRLNIEFETGAGLKVVIPTPLNAPVYELLHKFINKVVYCYKPQKPDKKALTKGKSGDIINKLSDARVKESEPRSGVKMKFNKIFIDKRSEMW